MKWKKFGYALILGAFIFHLGTLSIYALPHPDTPPVLAVLRDGLYKETLFHQDWPLFSSYYPLDTELGLSVRCLDRAEATANYDDITRPIWQRRGRSHLSPEHWITYRLKSSLIVPYFRYALLQEERNNQVSDADFFSWLEHTPTFSEQTHVLRALAARYCGAQIGSPQINSPLRFDLQLWACPLKRWREDRRKPCTLHPLGTFESIAASSTP